MIDDIPKHPDVGCKEATKHLSRQSRCLLCPFTKCLEDEDWHERSWRTRHERAEKIRAEFKAGKSRQELMLEFGLSYRTIKYILGAITDD